MGSDLKTYTVYLHTVPKEISGYPNDKYYVGITRQKIKRRWRDDGKGYATQNFHKVIDKYGWDSIKHEILGTNLTHDEACAMEQMYICSLQSNDRKHGYNLTSGGDGHFHWSEESRRKMSESRIGKYVGENSPLYGMKRSPEVRKNYSEAQKKRAQSEGYVNPRQGYRYTEEDKRKMSIAVKIGLSKVPNPNIGRKATLETRRKISEHHADISGINNPKSIVVCCKNIETNEVFYFPSMTQASRELHFDRTCAMKHLRNGTPFHGYMLTQGDKDEYIRKGYSGRT